MGSVFKKSFTKPLPPGAEIVERKGKRVARWRVADGPIQTARVTTGRDGSERISVKTAAYYARYRDADGIVREEPTGCRDETAARQVLASIERKVERVRSGLISASDDRISAHQSTPIEGHFDLYMQHLRAKNTTDKHRKLKLAYLKRIAEACGFRKLSDLSVEAFEGWIGRLVADGVSARNQNVLRISLVTFANWCVRTHRLASNPFKDVPRADEEADPRRRRRAMTEAELARLIEVAARRPLIDAQTIRRGKRKGQPLARVKDADRVRLEALGRERALIYKTLVLTGLRKNELATLTVAQLHLDGDVPHLELDAADEKSREGNRINIRDDLADDIRAWLASRLATRRAEAERAGETLPDRLPGAERVFVVPYELVKILDRDLKAAGIPKRDERGWTLDVHALRTTFGTLLGKGPGSARTTQTAMRHSDPRLTARYYTDPKLLEVRPSLDALPPLPLNRGEPAIPADPPPSRLAPQLASEADESGHSRSNEDEKEGGREPT